MAVTATQQASGKVVIRNVGLMLSGDIDAPMLDADTVVVQDGTIVAVGKAADCDMERATTVIDAKGTTLCPGLIDSHVHPVFGDWTPRQNQLGWIESCLNGGVTTMISAGEVHLPGRPKDVIGVKALAITAQRAFDGMRAAGVGGGVKVLAGAPVIEQGMVEQDFADMAAAGVTLLGEIGLGSVKAGAEAAKMVGWARKHGIQSTIHTGGPSIPGSGLIDEQVVLEADADVIGHVNGGHTSLSYKAVCTLCEKSPRALEIVHNGNERIAILTAKHAMELRCPHRVILGTDAPAGSGVQPLGILRLIALISSLADIPAEIVFGFATGNIARMRNLKQGLIEVGRPADFVFLDRAQHTAGRDLLDSVRLGDIPGVGMVMIDGLVRCGRSRNTPPAIEVPVVVPAH
ncbi:MAG: amidohydrolase family protein [Burkholderiaceae bacterium]|jgi:enamidase|nr:amidohydrolase family protein [Burkholderiales bacterium]MCZ8104453.1 amidohydrolase family protein [Burkholderiales bacterium]MCZ8336671.1 amidohydrolase family protein [Burkholderiaceae bacterium]